MVEECAFPDSEVELRYFQQQKIWAGKFRSVKRQALEVSVSIAANDKGVKSYEDSGDR